MICHSAFSWFASKWLQKLSVASSPLCLRRAPSKQPITEQSTCSQTSQTNQTSQLPRNSAIWSMALARFVVAKGLRFSHSPVPSLISLLLIIFRIFERQTKRHYTFEFDRIHIRQVSNQIENVNQSNGDLCCLFGLCCLVPIRIFENLDGDRDWWRLIKFLWMKIARHAASMAQMENCFFSFFIRTVEEQNKLALNGRALKMFGIFNLTIKNNSLCVFIWWSVVLWKFCEIYWIGYRRDSE